MDERVFNPHPRKGSLKKGLGGDGVICVRSLPIGNPLPRASADVWAELLTFHLCAGNATVRRRR